MSLSSLEIRSFCAEDPNLHPRHFALLDYINGWDRTGAKCYASQETIAKTLGCHVRTVGNHIKAAILAGFLLVTPSQSTNTYCVNPDYKESHSVKFTSRIGNKYRQYKASIESNISKVSKALTVRDLYDQKENAQEVGREMIEMITTAGSDSPHYDYSEFLKYNAGKNGADYSVHPKIWLKMLAGYLKNRTIYAF